MVDSGILLIKYWLEVSPDEQTRRLESRIDDPRKIWKLSDMDLKSYSRWYDYSRARDAMFAATDTAWAPWFVAHTDDKKRGRLNIISHLLGHVPYEPLAPRDVTLPKREQAGGYTEPDLPLPLRPGEVLRQSDMTAYAARRSRERRTEDNDGNDRPGFGEHSGGDREVVRALGRRRRREARRRPRRRPLRGEGRRAAAEGRAQRASRREGRSGMAALPRPVPQLHADHPAHRRRRCRSPSASGARAPCCSC